MFRKNLDLILITVLVLVTLVLTLAGVSESLVMFWVSLPLVFVAPGYTLTQLITGPSLGKAGRALLSLGLSFIVTILGGLILNQTSWGLQTGSWLVWLGGIALLGAAGTAIKRAVKPDYSLYSPTDTSTSVLPNFRMKWTQAGLVVVAVGVFAAAILVSRTGAETFYQDDAFTQLWVLPSSGPNTPGTPTDIKVGVVNQESAAMQYRVQVVIGGVTVKDWTGVDLAVGKEWEANTALPSDLTTGTISRVEVNLYRSDAPDKIYHQVFLPLGQNSGKVATDRT